MKTLFKLPRIPYILACSGGSDSMAAFAFLKNGKHDFEVAYFNHGTSHGKDAEYHVTKICEEQGKKLHIGTIQNQKQKKESPEEYWRKERYSFLRSFKKVFITAHNLDDVVETWLFSAINGNPKLIPIFSGNCIRPFLLTTKQQMTYFANRNNLSYIEDPSNDSFKYKRNYIRHILIPAIKNVNENICSTISKKLIEKVDLMKFPYNFELETSTNE